jgi:hypothetical protein
VILTNHAVKVNYTDHQLGIFEWVLWMCKENYFFTGSVVWSDKVSKCMYFQSEYVSVLNQIKFINNVKESN